MTFLVEYKGILSVEELEASSFFQDEKFGNLTISETAKEGIYLVSTIYTGDLRENVSSLFVMPGNMTYEINYITDYVEEPDYVE